MALWDSWSDTERDVAFELTDAEREATHWRWSEHVAESRLCDSLVTVRAKLLR